MRIAVISDLHVGPNGKAKQLCVPPSDLAMDIDFLGQFSKFVVDEGLSADFLIIAGDISEQARPNEIARASEITSYVGNLLGVPAGNIAFTPGNHDKDWGPLKGDPNDSTGIRNHQAYFPLAETPSVFRNAMGNAQETLLDMNRWAMWKNDDLLVVSYNSSWGDTPESVGHPGEINPQHAREIGEVLKNYADENLFRLFLVHHHPIVYTDPIPIPDLSIMANAESLMDLCAQSKIDMVVHGHKHVPRFQVALCGSRHYLGILCAGSFCKAIETCLQDSALNQFHVIELDDRDSSTNSALGTVWSWSHVATRGWIPSNSEICGIEYRNPFGRFAHLDIIEEEIRGVVGGQHQKGWLSWSEVIALQPQLQNVPAPASQAVLEKLQLEGLVRVVNAKDGNNILLFPEPDNE